MQFFMGLNDVYQTIRSNILARDPLPDVKEAFNVVSREESHRGLHSGSGSSSGNKVTKGAFSSSGSTNFDTPFTKDQMIKILSLINEKPTGNASANMAGMRPTFYNGNAIFNLHFEKFFYAQTCSYMYNLSVGWIIDSGANQHFTVSTKNIFNVTDISGLNLTVGHPNGTLAKISAIGNLRLTSNVVLFDVLVIPEYNVSLMSMHKLIKDSKLFVGFDETKCYIQDLNLVKTVGTGSEAAGLYLFDEDQSGKPTLGLSNSSFVCHTSKQLWHSRLGHPADQVLSILSKSIGFKYDKHVSPCDICHKAKQTKDPFPLSDHKSVALGDLVHLDLWGPYKVMSRDGYRSDNGTEFVNNKLAVFYKEKGIIHETSCAHTPQQNGIVERKHRHLLNVARGLPHLHTSEIPYDDEREQSKDDGNAMAPNNINSSQAVDEDATFATSLTENTNIFEGQHGTDASIPRIISDGLNSSNSGDEPQTVRNSDRVRSLPSKFNDYVMPSNKKYGIEKHVNYSKFSPVNMCFASNLNKSSKPKSLQEAMLDKNWIEAMNNEMEALFKNKTWVLVDLPHNRKTIGCKWLWKIKYKSSGEIERYKARLVAKGFSQRNGIDYEETFSPVVKMVIIRCIISLAVHYNWPLFQLDVNNAILYGDLHEDVKWIFPPDTMSYTPYETRSCKLVKKSKKQAAISRSSAEAEYRFLASTTCEVLWLTYLQSDLGMKGLLLVTLYYDSTSASQIAANPVFHDKTKHFDIDVHLVREKVSSGAISTVKINSVENIADVFTKGLSITQHKQFFLRLNLVDMFQPPSAATNFCRRKRGRLRDLPPETRLLSEAAATISTVPETAILVARICFCSSESEVCRKCLK
ncbi:ribonuclease H-like domain-containing protein [Tanacetum coccineum]